MKDSFYTSIAQYGSSILYRGVKNGRRVSEKIKYSPTLFLTSQKDTEWKNIHGENLEPRKFDSIQEARKFVDQYSDVSNFTVYGNTSWPYAFIADNYPDNIEFDFSKIYISILDIEVYSAEGFPEPTEANFPITAITVVLLGKHTVSFGYKDYTPKPGNRYIQCKDEYDLCKKFMRYWNEFCPDIITGWNVRDFDITYLVNRFTKIVGEDFAKLLSPWKLIKDKTKFQKGTGKEIRYYDIVGVPVLDYMELYKTFVLTPRESYRLDHIAEVELGENKLSYQEYDNLHGLYTQNFQKYLDYNVVDCELVQKLESKKRLLELAVSLAYDTKSNFDDVFSQVRMWDSLLNCTLKKQNVIVPPKHIGEKDSAYSGAFVKEPVAGVYGWGISVDLDSLYPHCYMFSNVSPDTIIDPSEYTPEMVSLLSSGVTIQKLLNKELDLDFLHEQNICMTPNGQFFRKDIHGFLPKLLEDMYADRKKYKKLMNKEKSLYEETKNPIHKQNADRANTIQNTKKLSLNSVYGAGGNVYFRFYDIRQATAITSMGQLAIQWVQNDLNIYMNNLLKTTGVDYVIYVDTDSNFLNLDPLVRKYFGDKYESTPKNDIVDFIDKVCENKIQKVIDTSYTNLAKYLNAYRQAMSMKREKIFDRGIWLAKKRYILNVHDVEGVRYSKPEIMVTGHEIKKSSTPSVVKKKMGELLDLIMNSDERTVHKFIDQFKTDFKKLSPDEIAFPRGCNNIKQYSDPATLYKKKTPINVKAAILYNHLLEKHKLENKYESIKEGEKIKFVYLKLPNPLRESVIGFPNRLPPEFGLHEYIDYSEQFDKSFVVPMQSILTCMNWNTEKQSTLEDFFS